MTTLTSPVPGAGLGTESSPPSPTILSRSASLIVSSRTRSEAALAPRRPITFKVPSAVASVPSPVPSPTRRSSILRKLHRSLSRRSSNPKRSSDGHAAPPPHSTVSTLQVAAPAQQAPLESIPATEIPASGATGLRRNAGVLGRSRSEGRRGPRVAREEEKMDVLVRRAERSVGLEGTDAGSGLGSYFWSDTLGVCWDGREQVRPDMLSSQPKYSSNADYIPVDRVVYASTLSTFPPRPPLRRLSSPPPAPRAMTEAEVIAAEYRAANGLLSPGIDNAALSDMSPTPGKPHPASLRLSVTSSSPYAHSVASDSSESAPSELRLAMGPSGRVSEDSSTSLESLEVPPLRYYTKDTRAPAVSSPLATVVALPRIALVDDGGTQENNLKSPEEPRNTSSADDDTDCASFISARE